MYAKGQKKNQVKKNEVSARAGEESVLPPQSDSVRWSTLVKDFVVQWVSTTDGESYGLSLTQRHTRRISILSTIQDSVNDKSAFPYGTRRRPCYHSYTRERIKTLPYSPQ